MINYDDLPPKESPYHQTKTSGMPEQSNTESPVRHQLTLIDENLQGMEKVIYGLMKRLEPVLLKPEAKESANAVPKQEVCVSDLTLKLMDFSSKISQLTRLIIQITDGCEL